MSGREQVLKATEQAVLSDRNRDYAPPEENFRRIADLWNVYLEGKTEVTPFDTAIMMVLVKVARTQASPYLLDHLVDMAGYSACAADVLPEAPVSRPPVEAEPDAGGWRLLGRGVHEGNAGEVYSDDDQYRIVFDEGGRHGFNSRKSMMAAVDAGVLSLDLT